MMKTINVKSLTVFVSILTLSVVCTTVVATDVYITRDKDGNPVFSDQPSSDAEKIVIPDIQTVAPTATPSPQLNVDPRAKIKVLPKYNSINILSPKDDESIRANSGKLSVQLAVAPEIRGNDKIVILLDGKEVSSGNTLSMTLDNVDRGTHSLQALVSTQSGEVIVESAPVTIHLLRTALPPAPPGGRDSAAPPGAVAPPPPAAPPGAATPNS